MEEETILGLAARPPPDDDDPGGPGDPVALPVPEAVEEIPPLPMAA